MGFLDELTRRPKTRYNPPLKRWKLTYFDWFRGEERELVFYGPEEYERALWRAFRITSPIGEFVRLEPAD